MNNKILFVLILITCFGGFLRFFKNTENPPSLNIDEVSFGYSAYSILKTGHDEHGTFMPLTFKSTGDYKNPVPVYLIVPSIAVFGLNEFGIRFPNALISTLAIPLSYLLFKLLLKKNSIALLGALLLSISPWHIYFSRYSYEASIATSLIILGVYSFLKIQEDKKIWSILAAISFSLSMYTAFAPRLFLPLFITSLLIKEIITKKWGKSTNIFITTFIVLVLPLAYLSIFGEASKRLGMIFLSNDIDYTRYIIIDHLYRLGETLLLFFFWVKRYLNYFQPDFLFFSGLNMTTAGTIGLGVLYLFQLPWLILGVIELIRGKIENKALIVIWILVGLLPASVTNNEQSVGRSLLVLPGLTIIVTLGASSLFGLINKIQMSITRYCLIGCYILFIGLMLIQAFLIFSVNFPMMKGEDFMEGTKETVEYSLVNKNRYEEIVFDPVRGLQAPNIVSIPYMYVLLYSKYDPSKYQQEPKRIGKDSYGFDKFTFRRIDWKEDRLKKNILLIGSPWDFPQEELKEGEVIKKIYMSDGSLAFFDSCSALRQKRFT